MKHYSILTTIALVALLCAGCAHDDALTTEGSAAPLALCPPANAYFTDGTAASDGTDGTDARVLMRAPSYAPAYEPSDLFVPGTVGDAIPSGVAKYLPYNKLYPTPINKNYTSIGAFLAQDSKDSYDALAGFFLWKSANEWTTTVGIRPGDFYLFGYMPSNVGSVSARIDKLTGPGTTGKWSDGATLTIANLNTVTPADVCVVVGVLKSDVPNPKPLGWTPAPIYDDSVVEQLRQGIYGYHGTQEDNYVYLLLDHLYTNVNMELAVEPAYAQLRTIVLREVYMKTPVRETVDAIITLTNSPTKPIKNIEFSVPSGDQPTKAMIFPALPEYRQVVATEGEGVTSVPGYFAPGLTTQEFEFEFHYDVYDKEGEDLSDPENPVFGNLVREHCIAINRWSLPGTGVQNGKSFQVKATIKPTYLYMLSDPDLNNPTVELKTVAE